MFYLFHHIPKTADTSVRDALGRHLRVHLDYQLSASPADRADFERDRPDLSLLTQQDVLCGHWNLPGSRLWERFPELDELDVRKIVILRPPLETAMSGVRYNLQTNPAATRAPDAMLLARVNYFASVLGCTRDSYRERIDSYWHVGLAGRVQETVDFIADTVGSPRWPVDRLNTTDAMSVSFSPEAVETFLHRSELDQAIYDYAAAVAHAAHAATA